MAHDTPQPNAPKPRQRRANGEESRRKILQAAAEIAGERGFEGTGIAEVSKRSGLPASSIYWHFTDKDDLITAVIDESFAAWLGTATTAPAGDTVRERFFGLAHQVAKATGEAPDFLRLGLMLTLERRPEEPEARRAFIRIRAEARKKVGDILRELVPGMDEALAGPLTTLAMATADGLFIAQQAHEDDLDLDAHFDFLATVLYSAGLQLGLFPAE